MDSRTGEHDATRLIDEGESKDGKSVTRDHSRSANFESQSITSQPEARRDPRSEILITDSESRTGNLYDDESTKDPERTINERKTVTRNATITTRKYSLCMNTEDAPDTRETNIDSLEDTSQSRPLNIEEQTYTRTSQVEARVEPPHEETHRTAYTNQLSRSPCKTVTRGDAPNDARTNQKPVPTGHAPDDRITTPVKAVRMNRNESRFERFDSELPLKTASRSPRNSRGKPETAKEVTTFLPRKLMTRGTSNGS
ncbi:hypothetical protein H4582DRAFT_1935635 [Lactarius indigo]|nr:hypothetical protein H4582DRAFT_1935635 [Lactarius indigo]